MDYKKFVALIGAGEKYNVDFKIKCNAFYGKESFMYKAELAKDICAMANNGNVASYIIVGVSDDGKDFLSVSNPKLIDDALQDFCKMSISPPPKINLTRIKWKAITNLAHKNKDFVIIQIGPQARKAFHLSRDFIDYDKGMCLRRNEVWIRRNATSDLATPDEIAHLVLGKPPIENEDIFERNQRRLEFRNLSIRERQRLVNEEINSSLISSKFKIAKTAILPTIALSTPNNLRSWGKFNWFDNQYFKIKENLIVLVSVSNCSDSLSKSELRDIGQYGGFLIKENEIPKLVLIDKIDRSHTIMTWREKDFK